VEVHQKEVSIWPLNLLRHEDAITQELKLHEWS
jgi:hypothetical protein